LGGLGLIVILTYTTRLTRYPLMCLVAPGLGFGTLMVMGTDRVLSGSYGWSSFVASLVPFFLVSDLLLLNQFPDVEADGSVGRRHLPIVMGRRSSSILYGAFLLLAYLSVVAGVVVGKLPVASLLGLITLVIAVPTAVGAFRHADHMDRLIPYMGLNVLLTVLTPVLVAAGLFIG
jgi:1,4-dihydroxy-2-naphthoate octaprenyltransferase